MNAAIAGHAGPDGQEEMSITMRAIAFGVVGLALLNLYGKVETWQILLLVEFALLAYGLFRPVALAGAIVFNEFTGGPAVYIDMGGGVLSLRLIMSLGALMLILPHFLNRDALGFRGWIGFTLAMAFFILATASNSANAYIFDTTVQYARYLFNFLAILLVIPAVVRNRDDLIILCWIAVYAAMLSGLLSVMQHFHVNGLHGFEEGRSVAFLAHPVMLAVQLPVALMPIVTVLILNRGRSPTIYALLAASALVIALGTFFTYTRTAYMALAVSPFVLLLYTSGKARKTLIIGILTMAAAGTFYLSNGDSKFSFASFSMSADGSTSARPVLWNIAFDIAKDHMWLGVGREGFRHIGAEYGFAVDPTASLPGGVLGLADTYDPHNDYIYALVSFGIIGLLLFLSFHIFIWWNLHSAFRSSRDWLLRALCVGGISTLAGYMVNAAFHNAFDGSMLLAVMMGISVVIYRLTKEEKTARELGREMSNV